MKRKTVGYICMINDSPAHFDEQQGVLCYASRFAPATLFHSRRAAAAEVRRSERDDKKINAPFKYAVLRIEA